MRRTAIADMVGLLILTGLLLAVGTQTATTVWADPSSMSWDMHMEDAAHACPGQGTGNDEDGIIETGECPDVVSTFWLQPEGGPGGTQPFFDRANVVWTTGPLGPDVTGDTIPDPTDGLTPSRPAVLGTRVGTISFQGQSNLVVGALLQNNIDDVSAATEPRVAGQPLPCGDDINGDTTADTLVLGDTLELWNAIIDGSNGTVSAAETQTPDPSYPPDCDPTGGTHGAACAPKGVTLMPALIPALETAIGFPTGSAVSRSYGIARVPVVAGISSNMDVNFLVYRLSSMGIDGYLAVTLVQYPGLRAPDPTAANYGPLAQSVQTCPPYWSSVRVQGITAEPDFDDDLTVDMNPGTFTPELHRLVVGTGGPYDNAIYKSTAPDYDGDTIAGYADRCDTDANSGSATGDTDGDTLTGTCESTGAGNGEGANPKTGGWSATPPWDAGQDVDADAYLNYVDNCPVEADRDLDSDTVIDYQRDSDGDGVGDPCDSVPTIPGDGQGYKVPSPGGYVDNPNICNNRWYIGQAVPQGEAGDLFMKYCLTDETAAATAPYANPKLAGARLSGYRDANNDAVPDFWDGLTSAAPPAGGSQYDYFDGHDADGDTYSDGCESFRGFDSLDPTNAPGAIPGSLDCDGDGTGDATELLAGTNPLAPAAPGGTFDSDGDGFCSDAEETAKGLSPTNWYDFYDVPVPAAKDPAANGVRNGSIDMGDVIAVLFYSGAQQGGPPNGNGADYDSDKNYDGFADGLDYDRTPGAPPGPPSTAIDMSDVIAALGQSGKACDAKGAK